MVRVEFDGLIEKLSNFFERRKPSNQTMLLWYDVIAKIPSQETEEIFSRITLENDTFPQKITDVMWAIHYKINESQNANKDYRDCPYCNHGLIHLRKKSERGQYYGLYSFRCDQCKQVKSGLPWGNEEILLKQGYEAIPVIEGTESISNWYELRKFIHEWGQKHKVTDDQEGRR